MAKNKKKIQRPSISTPRSPEEVVKRFDKLTTDLSIRPVLPPTLSKNFMFDLLKFYLKETEHYVQQFREIEQYLEIITGVSKRDKFKETRARKVMKNFPLYKKFLTEVRKYLKCVSSPELDAELSKVWRDTLDNYFLAGIPEKDRNTSGFELTHLAIHIAFLRLITYKSWYDHNKTIYSFQDKTTLDARKLLLNNDTFKPSELMELQEEYDSPMIIYIVDKSKRVTTVGIVTFVVSGMVIQTYNQSGECGVGVISQEILSTKMSSKELLKHVSIYKGMPVLKFITAISHFVDTEGSDAWGSIYLTDEALSDGMSIEQFFEGENTIISDVFNVLALSYYLTFKHTIEPEEEIVTTAPIPEIKKSETTKKLNKIKHYDIMESTVYIAKPSVKKGDGTKGTPKAPHYRSGHSHHFWVGSGENKKRVKYYIEGTSVNGYVPSDNETAPKKKIKNVR